MFLRKQKMLNKKFINGKFIITFRVWLLRNLEITSFIFWDQTLILI